MAPLVAARWLLLRRRPETGCSAAYAKYRRMRGCAAPSADRIFEIFAHVARHELHDSTGALVKIFEPSLTELQLKILEVLGRLREIGPVFRLKDAAAGAIWRDLCAQRDRSEIIDL